jgi:hypothetical protein
MTPVFLDVRHHTSIEDHLLIVRGITSAIKVDLVHNQATFLGMTRCASRSPSRRHRHALRVRLHAAAGLPRAAFYMHEPVKSDYLWAGVCLLGAVYFIFRS